MKKELLALVRQSIEYGYLPENWHEFKEEVVKTATQYLSLTRHCVIVDDDYYHEEEDSECFVFDQQQSDYILDSESILVYSEQGNDFFTHERYSDRYYEYNGRYYTEEGLRANNLVITVDESIAHLDDVYYWESDNAYHYERERNDDNDEDDDDGEVWGYHDGPCPPDYREDSNGPGIGFEIEKAGTPEFCDFWDKEELYAQTGCVMEKDGSVDWELKTPIYPLFSNRIENDWLPEIEQAVNASNHPHAGGHIHLSLPPKRGWQLFDYCRPYLPLFMAMYPKRLETDYCKGKAELRLKRDDEKHQAIKIWDNRIELRFPEKVYNISAIIFRLNFCRLMILHEYKNIQSATLAAFDGESSLSKLISQQYYGKELMLLNRVIGVAKQYFNTDLLKEKVIEKLLTHLKIQNPCVLQS
jgi:hypothetical protein